MCEGVNLGLKTLVVMWRPTALIVQFGE
jgi:hypothetical protein